MSIPSLLEAAELIESDRAAQAVPMLTQLVSMLPGYLTARILLAQAYEATGKHQSAIEVWRRAAILDPHNPVIRKALGVHVELAQDRPARASAKAPGEAVPERSVAKQEPTGKVSVVAEEVPEVEWAEGQPEDKEDASLVRSEAGGAEEVETEPDETTGQDLPADLDSLIHQLENAPRIVPTASPPAPESVDDLGGDLDEDEDLVSETLARIYAAQEKYPEAARAYAMLAQQHPAKADEYRSKAEEMRSKVQE